MRLGLRVSNEALHVLGAGQHGLESREKFMGCHLDFADFLTEA